MAIIGPFQVCFLGQRGLTSYTYPIISYMWPTEISRLGYDLTNYCSYNSILTDLNAIYLSTLWFTSIGQVVSPGIVLATIEATEQKIIEEIGNKGYKYFILSN